MKCNKLSLLFCLLLFFHATCVLAREANPPYVELSDGKSPEIRNELSYYQETDVKLAPEKAVNFYRKGLFKSVEGSIFNQPYTSNKLWLGLGVKNLSKHSFTFYYEIANPHLHQLELFRSINGRLVSLGVSGDAFPFGYRPLKNKNFVYKLVLSPQEETILLLLVNSGGRPVTIPISILDQQEFDEENMDSYLLWGIVSGFILLTATLSFMLFLLLKDSLYLIYGFNNILLLTWILGRNGLGYQYIWSDYPEVMARIMFVSIELYTVVYLVFMQLFVNQNKTNSRFFVLTNWTKWILLFLILLVFLPYTKDNMRLLVVYQIITDLVNFLAIFLLIAGVVEKVKQKNSLAKLLLTSVLFSFIGVIMALLVRMDLLVANAFTLNAVYIGFISEIILLAVGLALRYRYQMEERNRFQQELRQSEVDKAVRVALATENERRRIAADMHDDLGASLSGLQLMSELSGRKENMTEVKKDIGRIHLSAKDLSLKVKDIVWTLDPKNDTLENLVLYIHRYGQQLFEDSGIQYSALVPDTLPHLIVEGSARRQLLLLIKEAFANIIKHAQATEAFCTFGLTEDLSIHIQDNGKGMLFQASHGNGIRNMQYRVEILNGQVEITAEKGTTVKFSIPITSLTTQKGY